MKLNRYLSTFIAATALLLSTTAVAQGEPVKYVNAGTTISVRTSFGITEFRSTCTLGPAVSRTKALTAKHCGKPGAKVVAFGRQIGVLIASGSAHDLSYVKAVPGVVFNENTIASGLASPGEQVTKVGATTGRTSGVVVGGTQRLDALGLSVPGMILYSIGAGIIVELVPDLSDYFYTYFTTTAIPTTMHVDAGDSGAAVYNSRKEVVGIVSAVSRSGNECPNKKPCSFVTPSTVFPPS